MEKTQETTEEQKQIKEEIKTMHYTQLLTEEQIKECQEAFAKFDIDGNGTISQQEIHKILEKLGQNAQDEDIKKIFSEFDLDKNGVLDFDEFCLFYSQFELKDAVCNIQFTQEEFEKLMNEEN